MLKKLYPLLAIFLVVNFGALAIGSIYTGSGVSSDWYQNLNKAPWTPPGWVFGFAWTTIMICFTVFMAFAWRQVKNRSFLIQLFVIQWILNVAWNPIFFKFHEVLIAAITISVLSVVVFIFQFRYTTELKWKSLLVTPYLLWLLIATSLNVYILYNN